MPFSSVHKGKLPLFILNEHKHILSVTPPSPSSRTALSICNHPPYTVIIVEHFWLPSQSALTGWRRGFSLIYLCVLRKWEHSICLLEVHVLNVHWTVSRVCQWVTDHRDQWLCVTWSRQLEFIQGSFDSYTAVSAPLHMFLSPQSSQDISVLARRARSRPGVLSTALQDEAISCLQQLELSANQSDLRTFPNTPTFNLGHLPLHYPIIFTLFGMN